MAEEEKGHKPNQPEAPKKPAQEQGSSQGEKERKSTQQPPSKEENAKRQSEADKQKKHLEEAKQKAEKRLELKQEKARKEEELRQIKENVETACQEPEKLNLSSILEKGKPPQDQDLTLIVDEIVDKARQDKSAIDNEENLGKWIMELDAAGADPQKTDEAKAEIRIYKAKLARRLGEVVIEKARKQDKQRGKTEEEIKREDYRRKQAESHWRERLVEGELAPEDFEKNVKKPIPPMRGGQETTEETWRLFDETTEGFADFPEDVRQYIQGVNDDLAQGQLALADPAQPRLITKEYLTSVVTRLNELNGNIPRDIKNEMKNFVADIMKQVEALDKARRQEEYRQQRREIREYRTLGYDDEIVFLEDILGNPAKAEKFINGHEDYGPKYHVRKGDHQGNYEIFIRETRRIYDHLFDAASKRRREEFRESFGMFTHEPVERQIESSLDQLVRYFQGKDIMVTVKEKTEETNRVSTSSNVRLDRALEIFDHRLTVERQLREYNHNVHVVVRRRLGIEDFARFAQQVDATDVDVLFLEDELVQVAYRLYIQELKKMSADEFWIMGSTWLGNDPQGQLFVEEKVKEGLRAIARVQKQDLTDRDLNRYISLAAGTAFGITGEAFDILAQNRPPDPEGDEGFAGYIADNILPFWNMQHLFQRFKIPGLIPELLYVKILGRGTMAGWDHKEVVKVFEARKNRLKTGLLWSLSGGPPAVEVMSRSFGIRGFLSRGGWRIMTATIHHLVPTREGLPIIQGPLTWDPEDEKDEEKMKKRIASKIIWENIDWDASFANLERAGSGVMFSTWIDQRVSAEVKANPQLKKDVLTEQRYKEYLWKVRGRNPLMFLRYDLAQTYKQSLRYKVLGRLDRFKNRREKYQSIQGEVDRIERNLMLVVERINIRAAEPNTRLEDRWRDVDADWDVIEDDVEGRLAREYWRALQNLISEADDHGNPKKDNKGNIKYGEPINEVYDNILKEKYYFFGSEDIDFREFAVREAGFDVFKRVFADMGSLSKAVEEFQHLSDNLKAAAISKNHGDLVKSINTICTAIDGVHGKDAAQQMCYHLTTVITRYFDKSWWARIPFGIGTLANFILESSLSEKVGGKRAWQWDEQQNGSFIQDVRQTGYLAIEGKWSIDELRAEIGARHLQVAFDIMRSAIPLILLLIIWQAIQQETKE